MTLVESMAGLVIAAGGVVGAYEGWKRYRSSDARAEKREARMDSVDETVVNSLERVIKNLQQELERTQAQLARNDADTQRLAQGMTQMTAQIITQSNNMMVLKADADRFCNLLVKVKQTQDEMLRKGTLKDRIVDVNTDFLKYDPLK